MRKDCGSTVKNLASGIKGTTRLQFAVVLLCIGPTGAMCFYLYFKQAIGIPWDDSYAYTSDLPVHLGRAFSGLGQSENYSFNSLVFYVLFKFWPGNYYYPIAFFLALASALTIPAVFSYANKWRQLSAIQSCFSVLCAAALLWRFTSRRKGQAIPEHYQETFGTTIPSLQ